MRILFVGDVYGSAGRTAVERYLPGLRERLRPDVVLMNGENLATNGKGLNRTTANAMFEAGAALLTGGNHSWDHARGRQVVAKDVRVLRPLNHVPGTPGAGARVIEVAGRRLGVINLIGRIFMNPLVDCPFAAVDAQLAAWAGEVDAVFVDIHAEATSEKLSLFWHLDGRVSAAVGTHTHVQTNDARVLPGGTAIICDVGMTGSVAGVIGNTAAGSLQRFRSGLPTPAAEADGDEVLCGVVVDVDADGRATAIEAIRQGGPW